MRARNREREMRAATWILAGIGLLWSVGVAAQSATPKPRSAFNYEQWARDQEIKSAVFARANEIRPARRDTPMRELNITDTQVREIQAVAERFPPGSLVNTITV